VDDNVFSLQTEAAQLCFAFALHGAGHFVVEKKQRPLQNPGTLVT
jgi:hypothetical protein